MSELLAVVVGGVDYSEADRIIKLLTAHGRLSVFGHGARKSRRRLGGAFELCSTIRAELDVRRANGLPILTSATVVRHRLGIRTSVEAIALASYFAELASRMALEDSPCGEIFELLEAALDRLDAGAAASLAMQRAFQLRLLDPLGYRPELGTCVVCGCPPAFFDPARGGALCGEHRGAGGALGPKTQAWIRGVVEGQGTFCELGALSAEDANRAAEKVGRPLDTFFRGLVESPLLSEAVLERLLR